MAEEKQDSAIRLRRPIAFLYPPQPLDPCPMPREMLERFPRFVGLHSDLLESIGWEAPLRVQTTVAWPIWPRNMQALRGAHVGVVAFSWTVTQMLAEAGITPDVVFGHSLGLHSALAVSGAAPITDTLDVVDRTAQLLAQEHSQAKGAMLAITGFSPDEIAGLCDQPELRGTVFPAIINSPRQVVVSGRPDGVECLEWQLRAKKAWGLRPLPGHLPLHTPLMAPLADLCVRLTEGTHAHVPRVRLIHPTTGETVHKISSVEVLRRTHLLTMIDFFGALRQLERLKVSTYIEIGAGKTLTQLSRWYRRDLPVYSTGTPDLLERILHACVE